MSSHHQLPASVYEVIAQLQSKISDETLPLEARSEAKHTLRKIITTSATSNLDEIQRHILTARLGVNSVMSWDTPHRYAIDLLAVVADHYEVIHG